MQRVTLAKEGQLGIPKLTVSRRGLLILTWQELPPVLWDVVQKWARLQQCCQGKMYSTCRLEQLGLRSKPSEVWLGALHRTKGRNLNSIKPQCNKTLHSNLIQTKEIHTKLLIKIRPLYIDQKGSPRTSYWCNDAVIHSHLQSHFAWIVKCW